MLLLKGSAVQVLCIAKQISDSPVGKGAGPLLQARRRDSWDSCGADRVCIGHSIRCQPGGGDLPALCHLKQASCGLMTIRRSACVGTQGSAARQGSSCWVCSLSH
jgi:hypothetical protein